MSLYFSYYLYLSICFLQLFLLFYIVTDQVKKKKMLHVYEESNHFRLFRNDQAAVVSTWIFFVCINIIYTVPNYGRMSYPC